MARSVPPAVYDPIVAEIAQHPGGIGTDEIAAAFPALPRRTLQRHLARLVTDDRIRAQGQAVARRYLPVVARVSDAAVVEPPIDARAWMSDAGREVEGLVLVHLIKMEILEDQEEEGEV